MASRKKRPPYVPTRPAWMGPRRPVVGIFGPGRDFPLTTKELATLQKRQLVLFPEARQ
jgi:hypothetical protein